MWTLITLFFVNVHAWEIDNYTCRFEELADVSAPLNAEVNSRMQEVITSGVAVDERIVEGIQFMNSMRQRVGESGLESLEGKMRERVRLSIEEHQAANDIATFEEALLDWSADLEELPERQPLQGCNQDELLSAMRARLASAWSDNLETWATEQGFDQCEPETTIYDGFSIIEAPMLRTVGVNPVIRVGGHRIGVDKLSHFMTEGIDFYEAQRNGADLAGVLQIGEAEENGSYGLQTTGIKSYGDLAANYSGYQFWQQMFEGDNPYLACENNRWVQKRQFDWNDYVNPMFDESINCSEYKTTNMQDVVDRNTRALTTAHDLGSRVCPLDTNACRNVRQYYDNPVVLRSIVGPRCLGLSGVTSDPRSNETTTRSGDGAF